MLFAKPDVNSLEKQDSVPSGFIISKSFISLWPMANGHSHVHWHTQGSMKKNPFCCVLLTWRQRPHLPLQRLSQSNSLTCGQRVANGRKLKRCVDAVIAIHSDGSSTTSHWIDCVSNQTAWLWGRKSVCICTKSAQHMSYYTFLKAWSPNTGQPP